MKVIDAQSRFVSRETRIAEAIIRSGDLITRAIRAQNPVEDQHAHLRRLIETSPYITMQFED
mgnify:CR=1 FL=1